MRLRPLKNLVGISDVLGSKEFRFPDDQVYKPASLWARLRERYLRDLKVAKIYLFPATPFSDRAHILETKLCHQAQFVFALHFTTAYHKLQK